MAGACSMQLANTCASESTAKRPCGHEHSHGDYICCAWNGIFSRGLQHSAAADRLLGCVPAWTTGNSCRSTSSWSHPQPQIPNRSPKSICSSAAGRPSPGFHSSWYCSRPVGFEPNTRLGRGGLGHASRGELLHSITQPAVGRGSAQQTCSRTVSVAVVASVPGHHWALWFVDRPGCWTKAKPTTHPVATVVGSRDAGEDSSRVRGRRQPAQMPRPPLHASPLDTAQRSQVAPTQLMQIENVAPTPVSHAATQTFPWRAGQRRRSVEVFIRRPCLYDVCCPTARRAANGWGRSKWAAAASARAGLARACGHGSQWWRRWRR